MRCDLLIKSQYFLNYVDASKSPIMDPIASEA